MPPGPLPDAGEAGRDERCLGHVVELGQERLGELQQHGWLGKAQGPQCVHQGHHFLQGGAPVALAEVERSCLEERGWAQLKPGQGPHQQPDVLGLEGAHELAGHGPLPPAKTCGHPHARTRPAAR
uniref:Putative secreted protein n=1 Tax=Ixodes ricinus TaxID=34613 RepID=A0A0K8RC30_IXORI